MNGKTWTDSTGKEWELRYCRHCEVDCIICDKCENSSCNGGGCDYCFNAFKEFIPKQCGATI